MSKKRRERIDTYVKGATGDLTRLSMEMARMKNVDPLVWQQSVIKNRINELKEDLPHLYGWKWYSWAREFFESKNRMNLLCAANQCSKSSTAIRKNIEWAANKKLWPEIWPTAPKQFWYFYPNAETATVEVEKKFVPEFLPRGEMKHHENYGWDIEYASGEVSAIHFRSGCSIYFKSYGQKVINLQSSSVHMITFDEEAPEEIIDECLARLRATRGVFNQVFTATRGLQVWYRAMECIGMSEEVFPSAWKRSISLRDCEFYEDGSPSPWTKERVKECESYCTSKSEVLKRIDGRFVKDEGRKFLSFDPDKNTCDIERSDIDKTWKYYAGVDIGSGGYGRSAGAIVIIAVNPENTEAVVVKTWRGDLVETTAADILEKYIELKKDITITQACYDYQSREFGLIAARRSEAFVPADKEREGGTQIVNLLFQSKALSVATGIYDNQKLIIELMSVPSGEKRRKYQDDLTDALRYVAKLIPWDFSKISPSMKGIIENESRNEEESENFEKWEIRQRRGEIESFKSDDALFREEIEAWNELYGN